MRSGERVLVSAMRRAPLITDGGGDQRAELLLTFLRATATQPEEASGPSVSLDPPLRIGVEITAFEVPPVEAATLIWRRGEESSEPAVYAELVARVADGRAKLAASDFVSSRSGNRAKVERASSHVTPTEFELPLVAPTAWENRNVGQTLEIDAVLGPVSGADRGGGDPFADAPKAVDGPYAVAVNFAWQDVGRGEPSQHRLDLGEAQNFAEHPTYVSDRLTTSATLEDGEARLVGVVRAPGEEVARLIFLTALQVAEVPRKEMTETRGQVMMKTLVVGVGAAAEAA